MAAMDLKKTLSHLYNPPKGRFNLVDVPPMNFLMIDGHGDPNTSPQYQQAVEALYSLSYTIKFMWKKRSVEYMVMPLEGLWWTADMSQFSLGHKEDWDWTMMILQPEVVTVADVEQARVDLVAKKKDLPALPGVRFESYAEGTVAQIMYFGIYDDETETIAAMHQFIHDSGYELYGKHHEIYLNDPRRTAPDKIKTILRQPAKKVS